MFMALAFSAAAQSTDPRLEEHFGVEHMAHLAQNAPNLLVQYGFYVENVAYFTEAGGKDLSQLPHINTLQPKEGTRCTRTLEEQLHSGSFNALAFELGQQESAFTYYRTGQGNKILVVLPNTIYTQKFNEFVGASHEEE